MLKGNLALVVQFNTKNRRCKINKIVPFWERINILNQDRLATFIHTVF